MCPELNFVMPVSYTHLDVYKRQTTVTATATNSVGSASCTFNVTVTDNQAPILSNPGNQSLNTIVGTCAANYTIADPVSDNCSGSTWSYVLSGATTGSVSGIADGTGSGVLSFNIGITTVTLNGVDAAGNTALTINYTVTVIDNVAPTAICRPKTVYLNASGTALTSAGEINNSSTDNCGIMSYAISKAIFDLSLIHI